VFAIGNDELKNLEHYAADLADDNGEFEIIHTHEDGTEEIYKVSSGTDSDGNKLWSIGAYTTKEGKSYLAVVAGKVLDHVVLNNKK
jgi:hypothetical protein